MAEHILGFKGHLSISPTQQDTAQYYGLRIEHRGADTYEILSDSPDFNIEALCPPHVAHSGTQFSRAGLKAFLEFLHQPSAAYYRRVLDNKLPKINTNIHSFREATRLTKDVVGRVGYGAGRVTGLVEKHHEKEVLKRRKTMNRFFNFALNGTPKLGENSYDGLDRETADCHAGTEEAMREADEWRSEMEIGNDVYSKAVLSNTSIDLKKGFVFNLHPDFLAEQGGHAQKVLQTLFWDSIKVASGGRYSASSEEIALTAAELSEFYRLTETAPLSELVEQACFERHVQDKVAGITARVKNSSMKRAIHADFKAGETPEDALNRLLKTTSAFTPIMQATYIQDMWWRNNFTESLYADKEDTPYADLSQQYMALFATIEAFQKQGDVTQNQVEAIVEEFYPLLTTSSYISEILEAAATKKDFALPPELLEFPELFKRLSPLHSPTAMRMLPEENREAIEAIDEMLKTGLVNLIKAVSLKPAAGAVESGWDWTKDIFNYFKEDPKQAAFVLGLGGAFYLYSNMNGSIPDSDMLRMVGKVPFMAPDGSIEYIDARELEGLVPEEILNEGQNFHMDLKFSINKCVQNFIDGDVTAPYTLYKHITNYFMIQGTDWTMHNFDVAFQKLASELNLPGNDDAAYMKGAYDTMYPLAAFYFKANLLQNFSHTGFWGWAFKKGYTHGPKGALRILELTAPLTDPAYLAAVKLAEITPFKKKLSLPERLVAMTDPSNSKERQFYEGSLSLPERLDESSPLMDALSEAAQALVDLEAMVPADIRESKISLLIGGLGDTDAQNRTSFAKGTGALKRNFKLHADNLNPTLAALERFDYVLAHMAAEVGIAANQPWYRDYLRDKLTAVTTAVRDFQNNGDHEALQEILEDNLKDIMGAEIRLLNQSALGEALFEREFDKQEKSRLHSRANESYGRISRDYWKARILTDKFGDGQTWIGHKGATIKLMGVQTMDAMVASARKIQRLNHVFPFRTAGIGLAGLMAMGTVSDGLIGAGDPVSKFFSATSGVIGSSTVLSGIFAAYNWFWDDVVMVHLGTGMGLMATGMVAGGALMLSRPFAAAAAEKIRTSTPTFRKAAHKLYEETPTLRKAWWNTACLPYRGAKWSLKKASDLNVRHGRKLSSQSPDELNISNIEKTKPSLPPPVL